MGILSKLTKKKESELYKKRRDLDKRSNLGKKRSNLDKRREGNSGKSFLSITLDQSIEYRLTRNRSKAVRNRSKALRNRSKTT